MPEIAAILRHESRGQSRRKIGHQIRGRLPGRPDRQSGAGGDNLETIMPLEGGGAVQTELARAVKHDLPRSEKTVLVRCSRSSTPQAFYCVTTTSIFVRRLLSAGIRDILALTARARDTMITVYRPDCAGW